ncbi:MAG TPA: cytochrome b/b6 domain-containing protein [Ramlibacter sp.]|uniref:cytochrome b/b6 domain-containing protein n=1 Tax=Ramlibacter sp. TaxID=1917967 RepID=UPI002B5367B9|nr:cytochrome b/b6 domain-containing protein [Ramlibacter sp.]HVZ44780.1 cytochrome b/b6 domain-containing protein [Ramlibacter sp.]
MQIIYRHRLPVRIMHWINVVCLTILLMSGLQIFNAHPTLYWSQDSRASARVLEITQKQVNGHWRGVTRVGGLEFDTDGLLGNSTNAQGAEEPRAFPSWATIPGPQWLAMGRVWHFFFAWVFVLNGIAYLLWTIFSGHLHRDLVPTTSEWRGIGRSIRDHLLLRHAHGEEARRYNVLQNVAYLSIIFVVLPLIVLGGWAMSPMMDSFAPGWVDLFGGRQALRTLHFAGATMLVAFVLVHLFEVVVTGLVNNVRSMITGYWRLPE